jgi:hypothetical protein
MGLKLVGSLCFGVCLVFGGVFGVFAGACFGVFCCVLTCFGVFERGFACF